MDGDVAALDALTGKDQWSLSTGNGPLLSSSISKLKVSFPTMINFLYVLSWMILVMLVTHIGKWCPVSSSMLPMFSSVKLKLYMVSFKCCVNCSCGMMPLKMMMILYDLVPVECWYIKLLSLQLMALLLTDSFWIFNWIFFKIFDDSGKAKHLIPSLDGHLYQFNGENVEPVPLAADLLISSSFRFTDDSTTGIVGGKEMETYGIDLASGKVTCACCAIKLTVTLV